MIVVLARFFNVKKCPFVVGSDRSCLLIKYSLHFKENASWIFYPNYLQLEQPVQIWWRQLGLCLSLGHRDLQSQPGRDHLYLHKCRTLVFLMIALCSLLNVSRVCLFVQHWELAFTTSIKLWFCEIFRYIKGYVI